MSEDDLLGTHARRVLCVATSASSPVGPSDPEAWVTVPLMPSARQGLVEGQPSFAGQQSVMMPTVSLPAFSEPWNWLSTSIAMPGSCSKRRWRRRACVGGEVAEKCVGRKSPESSSAGHGSTEMATLLQAGLGSWHTHTPEATRRRGA
jgi:hypothetical protein